MPKFRRKPVVVDAVKWEGAIAAIDQLPNPWADGTKVRYVEGMPLSIITLEGEMKAKLGDWLIRDVNGELYPCRPDTFRDIYEPAED